MKREKQITIVAFETASKEYPISEFEGFIRGAKWADEHPNWISVEDELPTIPENYICVEVLFRTKDSANHLGKYFGDDDKWISYEDYTYKTEDISHWMLILPPRKEEHNDTSTSY